MSASIEGGFFVEFEKLQQSLGWINNLCKVSKNRGMTVRDVSLLVHPCIACGERPIGVQ